MGVEEEVEAQGREGGLCYNSFVNLLREVLFTVLCLCVGCGCNYFRNPRPCPRLSLLRKRSISDLRFLIPGIVCIGDVFPPNGRRVGLGVMGDIPDLSVSCMY